MPRCLHKVVILYSYYLLFIFFFLFKLSLEDNRFIVIGGNKSYDSFAEAIRFDYVKEKIHTDDGN